MTAALMITDIRKPPIVSTEMKFILFVVASTAAQPLSRLFALSAAPYYEDAHYFSGYKT
jgi:hypothetical protein